MKTFDRSDELAMSIGADLRLILARRNTTVEPSWGVPANSRMDEGIHLMDLMDLNGSIISSYPHVLKTWTILAPLALLTFITVLGNGTVIFMFLRTKRLRNIKNSFIASLAAADFLVGCTEPVSLMETHGGMWPSRKEAECQVYLLFRYSLCYVSLLSILFISVDRWWSIHRPFSYRVRQSKRLATWTILIGWCFSFLIHALPMISWEFSLSRNANKRVAGRSSENVCLPPYARTSLYVILSTIAENITPLLMLALLNISVYVKIRRRKTTKIRRSLSTLDHFSRLRKSSSDSENTIPEEDYSVLQFYVRRTENKTGGHLKNTSDLRRHTLAHNLLNSGVSAAEVGRTPYNRSVSFDVTVLANSRSSQQSVVSRCSMATKPPRAPSSTSDELVRDLFIRQDRKAACSLGLLVVVFTVCWTPHCICSVLHSFDDTLVPSWLLMITQWIVAANSAINPFLYAIGNAEFRKVLKSWVGCVEPGRYKHHQSLLYHGIQCNWDVDTIKETVNSN